MRQGGFLGVTKALDGQRSILLAALSVLLLALGAGSALAVEPEGEQQAYVLPTAEDVVNAVEAGLTNSGVRLLTNPTAAEGLPLEGIDRTEALDLLEGVFGTPIEASAGIYDELDGAELRGPNAAVIPSDEQPAPGEANLAEAGDETPSPESEAGGGNRPPSSPPSLSGASLLTSTVPLRVEDGSGPPSTVDLSLTNTGDALEPVAPLVETEIPTELGEGIRLPELGITIRVRGAPEDRAPSITKDSAAFYPNVASDVDFAVATTPTGVETFTQLRDPASPHTQVYELTLPDGATLLATEDGGAEVRSGENVLLVVAPPIGIDATGADVPVQLEVASDSLIVRAEPPADAVYPVLIDPLYQTWEWAAKNTTAGICSSSTGTYAGGPCEKREEWGYDSLVYPWGGLPHLRAGNGWGPAQPGIFVHAEGAQRAGDYAQALYTVPRFYKESPPPTSYIKNLWLSNVTWQALGGYWSPYLAMGLYDGFNANWVSVYSHTGLAGHGLNDTAWVYGFANDQPNKNVKSAHVGIFAGESTSSSNARVYVGAASVELGDSDPPQQPVSVPQAKWVDSSAPALNFAALDPGLGVYAVTAATEATGPSGAPLHSWRAAHGCLGVGNSACPRTWTSSSVLKYDPGVLPTGIHYISLVAEDPVGNRSSSSWAEVRVDHTPPSLSLSGTLTQQASVGTQLPEYTLNYSATDGAEAAPQSGAAKVEVRVDGTAVATNAPGCATKNCAIDGSWKLKAPDYAPGSHKVEVIATDAVGRSTTKVLAIAIERDTTAPVFELEGDLYTAPSGWVGQRPYSYFAMARDEEGSGVISTKLRIDGQVVADFSPGSCYAGSCFGFLGFFESVDMSAYDGGAHPAELIATDWAGNTRKRSWTIKVAPKGQIPPAEAADTLEAMEETTQVNPVGPAREEEIYGTAPGIGLVQTEGEYAAATGTAVPGTIASDPALGLSFQILADGVMNGPCESEEPNDPEADAAVNQFVPESEEAEQTTPSCDPEAQAELEAQSLKTIEIEPISLTSAASAVTLVPDETAAVSTNTSGHVDTIVRPLYEGGLIFEAIRTSAAAQQFSWRVELHDGQFLKLVDPHHATVYYESGHPAFGIAAEPARDAIGADVPTTLSVSGANVVTLHVHHQEGSFTYPVLAGTGWRGGFTRTEIEGPMDEQELIEERERIQREEREALEAEEEEGGEVRFVLQTDRWDSVTINFEGPPVTGLKASGPDNGIEKYTFGKKFKWRTCYWEGPDPWVPEPPPTKRLGAIEEAIEQCKGKIGWRRLEAKLAVHGWFRTNTRMHAVWILKGNLHCNKWGREQPAMVNCGKWPGYWVPRGQQIQVWGDYRFWPNTGPAYLQPPGGPGTSACVTVRGTIEYGEGADAQEPMLSPARQGDPCNWPYDD
jgi:hypothetical protein